MDDDERERMMLKKCEFVDISVGTCCNDTEYRQQSFLVLDC
jgi:hypothetical protein